MREYDTPESIHQPVEPPSVSRFVHTIVAYRIVIALSLAGIMMTYAVVAAVTYLTTPHQKVTTLPFRLNFEGATEGRYPNGLRFSTADVISTPVLLEVFKNNNISRFGAFSDFSRSFAVLEANREYDRLSLEYQSRLADPRLSPVERERILREFESKREAIAKNEYAIAFTGNGNHLNLPRSVTEKVLRDIVATWATHVAREQRVLQYRVSVISPEYVAAPQNDEESLMQSVQVLRAKIRRVLSNLDELDKLPGAELARVGADQTSIQDVRLRLEELIQFRLEPLATTIGSSALLGDRTAAIRFLENQLSYDERNLNASRGAADAIRNAIGAYLNESPPGAPSVKADQEAAAQQTIAGPLMPQVSESFLDRLITLANRSNDAGYRQTLVGQYRAALAEVIPAEQAVNYDKTILELVRRSGLSQSSADPSRIRQEIESARSEVRESIRRMHLLYALISQNLNPSTELFTVTAVATTRIERGVTLRSLFILGVVVLLLALPLTILGALLHGRLRREEEHERHAH